MADELLLSIEKLVYGGDGLAHADGNTVFVRYVLPGERVRAAVRTRKKTLVHADLQEVLEPSTSRIKPPCPHFGVCGGCHYQHIAIAEQVRLKEGILRETLSRLGGIQWSGEITAHTGEPYNYRNRAQWAFRDAMPRALGYFMPESAKILAIDQCPVLSPGLAEVFHQLQQKARANALPPGLLEIEAFGNGDDSKFALNVAFERFTKPAKDLAAEFTAAVPRLDSLLLLDQSKNRFELTGPGYLEHTVGGFHFRVNHLSFFQVNRFLLEDLQQTVIRGARGNFVLDLYAGVGFFTLPLGKVFSKVVSVDANLSATRDLQVNAETAGVTVVSHNESVEDFLQKGSDTPDFVVLDPPRSGLGVAVAVRLANLGAQEIAYLSCDPATLARDLAILTGSERKPALDAEPNHRYEIASIDLFDLFPETFHIETLVRLRRTS